MKEILIKIEEDNSISIIQSNLGVMEVYGILDYVKRRMFVKMGRAEEKATAAPKSTSHNPCTTATGSTEPSAPTPDGAA